MRPHTGGPLSGLKVVDLTWMLAGPYCTMLLADLGADVVKVEPPSGDPTRRTGPFADGDLLRAYGGYFQSVNRNKRSICLDLKRQPGKQAFRRLTETADVVVENFRPGVMERLDLGYESLHEANPSLVYACIRGFGESSPYMSRPAVDVTAQAMGGLMSITGSEASGPMKTGPGVGDLFPAALTAVGLLAAVRHAGVTGEGQRVEVALYDSVLSLCERIVYQYSYAGVVPEPTGNSHPLLCPFDVFTSADGQVAIAATEDHQWRELCHAMGREELGTDHRFATEEARSLNAEEVRQIVGRWAAGLTGAELIDCLGDDIPTGVVQSAKDVYEDAGLRARGMLVEVEQPGVSSPVTIAGQPIKLSATPSGVHARAPLLGEHSVPLMAELGYTGPELDALLREGVLSTSEASNAPN